MKTVIIICSLVTFVTAIPTIRGKFNKIDTGYDSTSVALKREKKSPLINDPVDEVASNNEKETTFNIEPKFSSGVSISEGRNLGLKKPLIIKKRFGYHLYRDSDEEKEYADPHESCSKQIKVKLCDEIHPEPSIYSNQLSKSSNSAHLYEHIPDKDVENSIKMAKEAVENLQRDLQNMEHNSARLRDNSNGEPLASNIEVQKDIEIAREALEQVHKSFGNLESMDFKSRTAKIEDTQLSTLTNEERLAQWKTAIENIHKNFEIARNIEDTFKMLPSDENDAKQSQQIDVVEHNVQEKSFNEDINNINLDNGKMESIAPENEKIEETAREVENIEGITLADENSEGRVSEDENIEVIAHEEEYIKAGHLSDFEKSSTFEKYQNTEDDNMFTDASNHKESKMELFSDNLRKEIHTPDLRLNDMEKEASNNDEILFDLKSEEHLAKEKSSVISSDQLDKEHDSFTNNERTVDNVDNLHDLLGKSVSGMILPETYPKNAVIDESNVLGVQSIMSKNALPETEDVNDQQDLNSENTDQTNLAKEANIESNTYNKQIVNEQYEHIPSVKSSEILQDEMHIETYKSNDAENTISEQEERTSIPKETITVDENVINDPLIVHEAKAKNDDENDKAVLASDESLIGSSNDKLTITQEKNAKSEEHQERDVFDEQVAAQDQLVGFYPISSPESEIDVKQLITNNHFNVRTPENENIGESIIENKEIQDFSLTRSAEEKEKDHLSQGHKSVVEIVTPESAAPLPRMTDLINSKENLSGQKSPKMDSDNDTSQQSIASEESHALPLFRLAQAEEKTDHLTQQFKSTSDINVESDPITTNVGDEKHKKSMNTKNAEEGKIASQETKKNDLNDYHTINLVQSKEVSEPLDQQFKAVSEFKEDHILPEAELSSSQGNKHIDLTNLRKAEDQNIGTWTQDTQELHSLLPTALTDFHTRQSEPTAIENTSSENGQHFHIEPTGMRMSEGINKEYNLNKNSHLNAPLVNQWPQGNENYHLSSEYKSVSQQEHSLPQMKTVGFYSNQPNMLNEETSARMSQDRNTYGQQFGDSHRVQDSLSLSWNQEEQNKYYQSQGYNNRPEFYNNNLGPHYNQPPYGYGYRSGNQFDLEGNHDFSHNSPRVIDHMHMNNHGKASEVDSVMQPSTQMDMRDSSLQPGHHHHHAIARFGASAPVSSGAVGVFPHSSAGCGIPLMLSCAPSVVSGSIARTHPSSIPSAFRSDDNMMYYMKRETKNIDEPIKVQKKLVPFNHKTEFIINKN